MNRMAAPLRLARASTRVGLHVCLALAVFAGPVATAAAAAPDASSPADADALSEAAVEKFEAKDYDGAAALFERAYEADPQPNYLFNIGRVYEEKGDLRRAVEFYQRFVGEPGVDLESRQAATERLRVLREALRELEGDPDPVAPTVTPEPEPASTDADDTRPDPARTRKLRIAGYTLLGVGGVALIAGGVVGGVALGTSNDAGDAEFVDDTVRLRRRAKRQANAADGLLIAGGTLAGVGLILVLSTLRGEGKAKAGTEARTQWSPMFGRGQVGLGMARRF
jgi:tetratricopeptide (TPR) repeat protein